MKDVLVGAARWVIDYLEIPNYLNVQVKGMIHGEKTYNCEETFWRDVLGPSFHGSRAKNAVTREGDVVVLRNFQLSHWYPRLPGLYWTSAGKIVRSVTSRGLRHSPALGLHFDPWGKKQRMTRGGLGTIRLAKHDRLSMYGATTSGKLDAAVPVLVSSNVAGKLLRFTKRYPLMEVDLKGTLRIIPQTYMPDLWSPHVPKLCLYVSSILNAEQRISDFALRANAWTIYHDPRARSWGDRFGYTYCPFNPVDESSIIEATDWISNYIDVYTKGRGFPLTDYDEHTCRFQSAALPLANIMSGSIDYDALGALFGGLDLRQQDPLRRFMRYR
jgi:hypothetical protein